LANEAKFMAKRREQLESEGFSYPSRFPFSHTLSQFKEQFGFLEKGESGGNGVKVCGRVQSVRGMGKNLLFIDILQGESQVQVKMQNKGDIYKGVDFASDCKMVKRGDIVGVEGTPVRTNAGELSVLASSLKVLSPTIRMMPPGSLENQEKKYRQRHLDLMTSPDVRDVFRTRSAVVQHLREFLSSRDFMEVETPTLISGVGGAAAKPFKTHHQDLNLDLSLRVAPELHLKMLTVGGFERVFEIGKQFRNERTDRDHNPEFTSCEFYLAYADYQDLITLTEQLLSGMASTLASSADTGLAETPYARLEFLESLESATGSTFPDGPDVNNYSVAEPFLRDACARMGVQTKSEKGVEAGVPKLYDKLFSQLVEPELKRPTFVCHHPTCMSPLARPQSSRPHLTERFELFVGAMELINAYSELNDPAEQKRAFAKQSTSPNPLQDDFVAALESGLPPTAGWGLGVDRLVMILTGARSIRDVILFPTMKPIPPDQKPEP